MSVINHNNHVTIKAWLFIAEVAIISGEQLQPNHYKISYGMPVLDATLYKYI